MSNLECSKKQTINSKTLTHLIALRLKFWRSGSPFIKGLKKWELMREVSKRLAEFQPDDIQWTISLAYATRRADSIQAAKEILLNAEPKFPKEGIIKHNLAC